MAALYLPLVGIIIDSTNYLDFTGKHTHTYLHVCYKLNLCSPVLSNSFFIPMSVVAEARSGKNKTGGLEDDLENVPPINQCVAMAIAGNPISTLGRSALVSMASLVKFLKFISR